MSGFGKNGDGDKNDNFKVECLRGKDDGEEELWQSDTSVRFMHVETRRFLASSAKAKFSPTNCPRCPIIGELELSGTNRKSQASTFQADDGVYFRL